MNYKEITDWIISCRQSIVRENFDRIEDYYIELEKLCNEWENIQKQMKAFTKVKTDVIPKGNNISFLVSFSICGKFVVKPKKKIPETACFWDL